MTLTTSPASGTAYAGPLTTPRLDLDLDVVERRYRALVDALPRTTIHYAVKANPHPAVLRRLAAVGAHFDVASAPEVRAALDAGATPTQLVHSNPVKAHDDVVACAALGVTVFVVDSPEEVRKVAAAAPGADVLVRLETSGIGSDWPLSRKYGCTEREATRLLLLADVLGLGAAGVCFHVGSQQREPGAWAPPIEAAGRIFALLREAGLRPWLLDLGGGFPADLEGDAPPLTAYGAVIDWALGRAFGLDRPRVIAEPGRAVVADAGSLVATVISVVTRGDRRWVFLDAGVFTGLVETLEEAVRYRLESTATGPTGPCVLAGPTCDSADVMYEHTPVDLPLALAEGDQVVLRSAGAYTTCYSTVGFNGFAPLPTFLSGDGA